MRFLVILVALLTALPAGAQQAPAMFGHLSYPEAPAAALVEAPAGFALGQRCLVQPAMLGDLGRMLAAASAAGVSLRGISCYRSYAHQHAAFCRRGCSDAESRAHLVGPPGYSEHATGYAIDFGQRPARGCGDVSPCFAQTAAGQWLAANAPTYGFELSFPDGNAQGVAWEPWHWRWVGDGATRALFERARLTYPARPAVPALVAHIAQQPPVPGAMP